jgi:hypothetical protein
LRRYGCTKPQAQPQQECFFHKGCSNATGCFRKGFNGWCLLVAAVVHRFDKILLLSNILIFHQVVSVSVFSDPLINCKAFGSSLTGVLALCAF